MGFNFYFSFNLFFFLKKKELIPFSLKKQSAFPLFCVQVKPQFKYFYLISFFLKSVLIVLQVLQRSLHYSLRVISCPFLHHYFSDGARQSDALCTAGSVMCSAHAKHEERLAARRGTLLAWREGWSSDGQPVTDRQTDRPAPPHGASVVPEGPPGLAAEAEAAGVLGPVHKAPGAEAPRCTLTVARGSPRARLQTLVLQTLPCGSFAKGVAGCVTRGQLSPACAPHRNVPLCFLLGLTRRLAPLRAREWLPPGTTDRPPGELLRVSRPQPRGGRNGRSYPRAVVKQGLEV